MRSAFSPDGKSPATGSRDQTAKIWDLQSGQTTTLEGHPDPVWSVAFSPDGKSLATGSDDQTAKIWDLQSRKATTTLEGHTDYVRSVAFSPDGKSLATGSSDKTAKIWDLQSGKASTTLEGHTDGVLSVAFSPDGKSLATGSSDKTAKIWTLDADALILQAHTHRLAGLPLVQLQAYNQENLLDQKPGNEAKLIATDEVWQITAFADLYANQARGSNVLVRVEPLYARADRLYTAALALQDELFIREKQEYMLQDWAQVYRENGLEKQAAALEKRLDPKE